MSISRQNIAILIALSIVITAAAAIGSWHLLQSVDSNNALISNGRLEARQIRLASRLSGRVERVLADEGAHVTTGDVLVILDSDSIQAQIQRANAQVQQAKDGLALAQAKQSQYLSECEFAKQHLQRTMALKKKQYVSDEKLDDAQNRYRSAQAACNAADAQVAASHSAVEVAIASSKQLAVDLNDMRIKAPLSGYVLYRLVEPGEVVPPGGRVMTLLSDSDIYMTVFLPSAIAGRLQLGDEAIIRLDAIADLDIPATVSFVSPEAQFTPKTVETATEREKLVFRVKLSVKQEFAKQHHRWLKPGMPGIAIVDQHSADNTPHSPPLD